MVTKRRTTDYDGITLPSRYNTQEAGWKPTPFEELWCGFIGDSGSGKSSLLLSLDECIVEDFEGLTRDVMMRKAHVTRITKWEEWLEQVDVLVADKDDKRVKQTGIDSGDFLMQMAIEYLSRSDSKFNKYKDEDFRITEWGQGGAGWDKVRGCIMRPMHRLLSAGYGVKWTGNAVNKVEEVDGKINRYRKTVLANSIFTALKQISHYVFELEMDTELKEVPVLDSKGKPKTRLEKDAKTGEEKRVPVTRKESVPIVGMAPHTQSEIGPKMRYIQYLPEVILLPMKDPASGFKAAYEAAIAKARADVLGQDEPESDD